MEYTKEQLARMWMQCAPMSAWKKLQEWTRHLGGAEQLWDVFSPDFHAMLGDQAYADLSDARESRCSKLLYQLDSLQAHPVFLGDPEYPALLSEISSPPQVLFCRGQMPPRDAPAIAIVGSRASTRYGSSQARRIARELAMQGVVIVSGLAKGIDAAAHWGAIEGGGKTVAVLGSGVGVIYPPENKELAQRILSGGGAIVSELAPDAQPYPYHFPVRNRIIAGFSDGVLLIEARLKSGTHTTVNDALDQGREVFALPGNVDAPGSELPLQLLKEGAKMCTCAADITEAMGWASPQAEQATFLPEETPADPILKALQLEEKTLEELIAETGMNASQLGTQLTLLEISGRIERRAGRAYALRR